MNTLSVLIVLVLGGVLQAVLPTWSVLGEVRPPVLLGCVVYYALCRPRPAVVAIAILAGAVQDALGMIPLGYSSFAFALVALPVNRFREEVFVWEGVTHMVFGGCASLAVTLLLFVLLRAGGAVELPVSRVLLKAAGSFVLGLAVTPLVYAGVRHVDVMLGNAEREPA